ncbi:ATP-dependent zinc metalloprotease FtsH [Candidatus Falkowbacteria bacterium]|jgi:cell division protease FtsH|nr:ATP-dependent zinc metalloprotease FtsH [Candidatus Falkowbacteria bacterium]MBT4432783.1 ATP-dependent zinc metalloprotease FtsH [Candidatus Falkowbacteria bacterium]
MKNILKNFLIVFFVILMVAGFISLYSEPKEEVEKISIIKLIEEVNNEEVEEIIVENDILNIVLYSGEKQKTKKEGVESLSALFKNLEVSPEKTKKINITIKEESGTSTFVNNILPFLIPFLLIGFFIFFMMRQVQGMNKRAMGFGQTKAKEIKKDGNQKITFKNVAGVKEAKEELFEVVDFLKDSKKFTDLGAKIPKGVLLLGPPGVGKTLLARAVAGEAGVPFFHISGSEFVEMFVGVGASRVRDLFGKAKKNAPSILFIDEIDAVGRRRGSGMGGSHDEREQTLNQILVEMDGFEPHMNVIVIAATNRPDVLDPALLRPGRFDRRVMLDLPDINDRESILKVHVQKKPLEKNVSLREVAERTPGFSGADLENLLNEAAILTVRRNKKKVGNKELLESIEKVLLGPERKSHILGKEEKKITAYHEAGHALVAKMLPNTDPVHKVSIISRGKAAGYTLKLPREDRVFRTKSNFVDELSVFLAGYMAEKLHFGEVTTGATNDLRQATGLAKKLITEFGMAENLPPRTYGAKEEMIFLGREIHEQKDYSEKVAEEIDKEVADFIKNAQKTAEDILVKNKEKLKEIVTTLIKKETIEREEFDKMFK